MAKKDIATQSKGALAGVGDYGDMAGQGYENQTSADLLVPFLSLIQTMSPQLIAKKSEYIEGAAPGMFFDSVTQDLFDGEKGVTLVPCLTEHVFTEWVPREKGGGFRGRHDPASEVVVAARARSSRLNDMQTDEGNDLIETFYMYCVLLDEEEQVVGPVVLSFTSSKIKMYKRYMNLVYKFKGNVPLFAHKFRLTSFDDENTQGQPFKNVKLVPTAGSIGESLIPPGDHLLSAGQELSKSVRGGSAQANMEGASSDGGEGDVPF